jgi:hypothetical protein
MPNQSSIPETHPVEDTVPKVNNELAVGSNLEFQHRWARAERVVWVVLLVFLLLAFLGVFGRGPLAHATYRSRASGMRIKYERYQRFGTPSVMTVDLDPSAIREGTFQLWVSDALVKPLGTQRVVPQPLKSEIGSGGILYTFAAKSIPASVEFQTQPSTLGSSELTLGVPGHQQVRFRIFVFP